MTDNWEICDQCCQNLFGRTPFALTKAKEWTRRPERFVKRAGVVLVAVLAVHDKRVPDYTFADLVPVLIAAADDDRRYVRKGGSWALRQIGKHNDRLRAHVLTAVARAGAGDRPASRWLARNVAQELGSTPRRRVPAPPVQSLRSRACLASSRH